MSAIFAYIDLQGGPVLVGRLWSRLHHGRESATFEYDKDWLTDPQRFSLEPALYLGVGPQHTAQDQAIFGSLGDSAPDRWGRTLMRYGERRRAARERRTPRTLGESDYLLLVDDESRQGALRFSLQEVGPFLAEAEGTRIPPVIELPRLLAAASHFETETDTDEELRLLLAPGSSLGGARPKATVRESDGRLAIAKFPQRNDDFDVESWEGVALSLAQHAGITVPSWRMEQVSGRSVLLLERFDRSGQRRIPFLSAMSMLGARDHQTHSYLEIADAIRQHGASPGSDLSELWRRMVFNVLISNTDDHLRNHGFLYDGTAGWKLSPAYDLNPVPTEIKPRLLSTTITFDSPAASLDLAFEVAEEFGLHVPAARNVAREVGTATSRWRHVAKQYGIAEKAIARMASAFEHEDLILATRAG
ncbi:MAG: HipA domain-containing protein [Planctomycetota bacterium]|nr:HipA domain-containing protein [Planctomycetota bacterium]